MEPKPVYTFNPDSTAPADWLYTTDPLPHDSTYAGPYPYDPSLAILLADLREVCLYSGADQVAICRAVDEPVLIVKTDGHYIPLIGARCGTLVMIRFPGHDGGPPGITQFSRAEYIPDHA